MKINQTKLRANLLSKEVGFFIPSARKVSRDSTECVMALTWAGGFIWDV